MAMTKLEWESLLRTFEAIPYGAPNRMDEYDRLWDEYAASLPIACMGVCPFCGSPALRKWDPYGFEGFWWQRSASARGKAPCVHYCLVRGAVSLPATTKLWRGDSCRIGPEVPYVIPRLLKLKGMVAVIGELQMEPGFRCFPITYYAEVLPPARQLTADWQYKQYTFRDSQGRTAWRTDVDVWDFELKPWIKKGRLRWCVPGSDNRVLADPTTPCPYLDLPGYRGEQHVSGSGVLRVASPDGDDSGNPFED